MKILDLLDEIQQALFNRAFKYREENTRQVNTWDEFKDVLENKAGFISAHWDGSSETEQKIKEETKATIRLIPLNYGDDGEGNCVYSGKPSKGRVIFAKAY
jgi:prolyl-tRNA synthetase